MRQVVPWILDNPNETCFIQGSCGYWWSVTLAVARFVLLVLPVHLCISWQNMKISCLVGKSIISPAHLFLVELPIPRCLWCWAHAILLEGLPFQFRGRINLLRLPSLVRTEVGKHWVWVAAFCWMRRCKVCYSSSLRIYNVWLLLNNL